MTSIKWLGGDGEPESIEWNGVIFPAGKPVDVSDPFIIKKARTNPHFEVDGEAAKPSAADRMAAARAAKAAKQQHNI